MDNHKISAFQATQSVCLNIIKAGFGYTEGGFGKRSCVWEKQINEHGDSLQIYVIDAQVSPCEINEVEPICFEVHVIIDGAMNIEVVRHDLTFENFSENLLALNTMVNNMIGNFRRTHNLGIEHHDSRMAS